MIQKQRELYEAPTTLLIDLRVETAILNVSGDFDINDFTEGETDWFLN